MHVTTTPEAEPGYAVLFQDAEPDDPTLEERFYARDRAADAAFVEPVSNSLEFLRLLPLGATRWFSGHLVTRHDADAYEVGDHGHYNLFTAAEAAELMEA